MNEYLGIPGILNGTIRTKKQYLELLNRVEALLEGVKYSIDDSAKTQVPIPEKTDIDKVLHLCERFESFARIFCSSPHGKCKLVPILSNEYDLQHIFYSLLALDFDHIQPEEPTPTFAASFTKMDFYLKEERIGIELKYATKANGEKQIKKDLLEDIPQYSTDIVDHIVCFIYDPQKEIKQPINFKSTFEKHSNTKAKVHVVIAS